MEYFCERCGCTDPKYFVWFQEKPQCRRCIQYQGQEGDVTLGPVDIEEYLTFSLTPKQKQVSQEIYETSLKGDVLVHAVCGAGKSELIIQTLSNVLSSNQTIGITVARRQVVLELAKRYQAIYPNIVVTPVCEGYTTQLSGNLIICTSHQLYRFHKYFDYLVIDEPDAFPFVSDDVLQGFAKQATKGVTIYLTATPSTALQKLNTIQLFRRPHGLDLPVPMLHKIPLLLQVIKLKQWLNENTLPKLIFVPTKKLGNTLSSILKIPFAYAGKEDLDQLLKSFKENKYNHLLCTTVLERGLTFENVQVAVLEAHHPVFTEATLIQIAGRVGRSARYPSGEVHFYLREKSEAIKQCVHHIQIANRA